MLWAGLEESDGLTAVGMDIGAVGVVAQHGDAVPDKVAESAAVVPVAAMLAED